MRLATRPASHTVITLSFHCILYALISNSRRYLTATNSYFLVPSRRAHGGGVRSRQDMEATRVRGESGGQRTRGPCITVNVSQPPQARNSPFATTWVGQAGVVLGEISHTEKANTVVSFLWGI